MDKTLRNPAWFTDELTLGLDLNVKTGGNPAAKDDPDFEALSAIPNKIHRLNGGGGRDTLRNRNGVYMKVMHFQASDSAYLNQGQVGMQRGNRLEGVL
ncbi:hypothetical protein C8J24_3057 [Sphingomonas aerolata]|uniref:Uncharacterized protein n=1 Tax=Sphingomonas aerolata TaxID=185951 RepID=A0A2T4YN51_9SPHN|nr:hypothetical protein [Sphingomonas aerolata]PTM44845.1 hypothetical protein C8J24_3057 [Sphingomonas aerolata]